MRDVAPAAITPLAWVRWDCSALTNADWLQTPLEEQAVWVNMLVIAAKEQGRIRLTVSEIAFVAHHENDVAVFERAIERFIREGSLRREGKGFRIVNFAKYNPPSRFLGHGQRPAKKVSRNAINHDQPRLRGTDDTDDTERNETNDAAASAHDEHDRILMALGRVPGWIFREDDYEWLDGTIAVFVGMDIAFEVGQFEAWVRDHRLGKNPRLALRNWLKNTVRYEAKRAKNGSTPRGVPLPSIEVQNQRINAGLNPLTGERA